MGQPELAGQTSAKKGVLDPIIALLRWIWDRLERTLLLAIKLVFPSRFISPLGFLGMLTVIVFLILGVTGALLLFHFQPIFGDCPPAAPNTTYVPASTCNSAFNSVSKCSTLLFEYRLLPGQTFFLRRLNRDSLKGEFSPHFHRPPNIHSPGLA